MAYKWEIRLSGTGGQGVIKASVILAEAALIDGHNAVQSQVYGPESRGSATRAEVKISDSKILMPKVVVPNILLCMSVQAFNKYAYNISDGGLMILDGDIGIGEEPPRVQVHRRPIIAIARENMGDELYANTVALGLINKIASLVSDDSMFESLERNFSARLLAANIRAYRLGLEAASHL